MRYDRQILLNGLYMAYIVYTTDTRPVEDCTCMLTEKNTLSSQNHYI